ncbi:MAG: CopG family transcriptional regulator [Deltaproteobacteria bacterium]|nr:CopG family transcriptional regulator [Deltaproteobacteria bacterium]
MSEVMTVRVELEVRQRLEKLAKATARTKSFLAAEAIRLYLDINEWQIGEIENGLREADAGMFASDEEVSAVFAKQRGGNDR